MTTPAADIALALSRQYAPKSRLLITASTNGAEVDGWRSALRQAGVPTLELNEAAGSDAALWLKAASDFSGEFLVPVVVFGRDMRRKNGIFLNEGALAGQHHIDNAEWLLTRQVALTHAVENSLLNQEFRRSRERQGWIRIGWYPEAALAEGNGLLLAWSSPLPLRRIRDFAARCPKITMMGPDAEALVAEVAAQGISVSGWRFAVK
jgi:hypothetical protein